LPNTLTPTGVRMLAEAGDVDAGAGADRGQEQVERRRGGVLAAALDRLVGPDDVPPDLGVDPLPARQGDEHLARRARHVLALLVVMEPLRAPRVPGRAAAW
jgi:hypothetical protein